MAVKPKRGRPRKWKQCPGCFRRKLIADDYYIWNGWVSRLCKECTRARRRERYRDIMADPYTAKIERARPRRGRRSNAERCRDYRARLKAERPEVYQQQLEDMRIRQRLQRERQGKALAVKYTIADTKQAPVPKVPVAPLVAFLGRVDLTGVSSNKNDYAVRATFRVLNEVDPSATVPMTLADRILTTFNGSLATVYPELYS